VQLYSQVLFVPAYGEDVTLITTEAPQVFGMPSPDPSNTACTIFNGGAGVIYAKFVANTNVVGPASGSLQVAAGQTVLLQTGDGSFGDAASTATSVTIAGRGPVVITRGTATPQQIFADR
jgi:hypothetical protein